MRTTLEDNLLDHLSYLSPHYWYYFRASQPTKYDNPFVDVQETANRIAEMRAIFRFIDVRKDDWLALFQQFDLSDEAVRMGHLDAVNFDYTEDQHLRASVASTISDIGKSRYQELIQKYIDGQNDDLAERHKKYLEESFSTQDEESQRILKIYERAIERNHFISVLLLLDENDEEQAGALYKYKKQYEAARSIYDNYVRGSHQVDLEAVEFPSFSEEYLESLIYKKQNDLQREKEEAEAQRKADAEATKAEIEAAQQEATDYVEDMATKVARIQEEGAKLMTEYQQLMMAGKMDEANKIMDKYQELMASL